MCIHAVLLYLFRNGLTNSMSALTVRVNLCMQDENPPLPNGFLPQFDTPVKNAITMFK